MVHLTQLTDSADANTLCRPLFPVPDDLESWEREPLECFKVWLSLKKIAPNSARIYLYMWEKFVRWKARQYLRFASIKPGHIDRFLNEAGLTKHHRYRYVRLIERVYVHLALENPAIGNPGSLAARQGVGEGSNDPMRFLREDQRESLIQWITRDTAWESFSKKEEAWKEQRDLAAAAAMLGGGLKVGEARRLSVSCIDDAVEWIRVDNVDGPPHRTRLLSFAQAVVERWIETRKTLGIPGEWVFVSSGNGRQMDAATLYRRIQRVMERAGVDLDARESPQTLRNTFAATLADLGVPGEVAAGYLGLRDGTSFDRLRGRLASAQAFASR